MSSNNELLNVNLLADAIGHHRSYVTDMKKAGFVMIGGLSTVIEARAWLLAHPDFRTNRRKKSYVVRDL